MDLLLFDVITLASYTYDRLQTVHIVWLQKLQTKNILNFKNVVYDIVSVCWTFYVSVKWTEMSPTWFMQVEYNPISNYYRRQEQA